MGNVNQKFFRLPHPSEYTHNNLKAFDFLCATMFKTFIIIKFSKNLNVEVSKQRYKNIYLNIFIKSLF